MIVDEVQDLQPKTIQLLSQLTKHRIFMVGDSAQTITEGSTSKVGDINAIFRSNHMRPPQKLNLSINYRSTNQIIENANLVVSMMETFFPHSIDIMAKEVSDRQGPKPYLIGSLPEDLLDQLLFG